MTTIVFGIDGADPELVQQWKDELPGFRHVMNQGFFGDLDSITPPITVPAWMCMFSGKQPGTFGVHDFHYIDPEEYDFRPFDSSYFRGKTLIDGKKSNILSFRVPGTTPGYDINGTMVTGFMKGTEREYFPENVSNVEHELDLKPIEGSELEQITLEFENNYKIFKHLLTENKYDTIFSVFRIIDATMHAVHDEQKMKEAYIEVDKKLQNLLTLCEDRNWNLLIVSDHGSGQTHRKFYLNAWLEQENYLQYTADETSTIRQLAYRVAKPLIETGMKPLLNRIASVAEDMTGADIKPVKMNAVDKIDFSQTEAFSDLSGVSNYGSVWIHDTDRFSKGTVEKKAEKREEIRAKLENHDAIENIWSNDEVFNNPKMPDLIVATDEKTAIGIETYPYQFHETSAVVHNRTGLIAGIGPDFIDNKRQIEGSLIDIGPTIQAIQEGTIDPAQDGQVIDSILKDVEYSHKEPLEEIDI